MSAAYKFGDVAFGFAPMRCSECGAPLGVALAVFRPLGGAMRIEHVEGLTYCAECARDYQATLPSIASDVPEITYEG